MTNFTPEQLIAYHYGELSPQQSLELEEALRNNWMLQEKYKVITDATRLLNKHMQKPGWRSLQSVLDHAQDAIPLQLSTN